MITIENEAGGAPRASDAGRSSANQWWWVAVLGLGLTVFSAKLLFIAAYGTDVPYWDQWDGEGAQLIRPFVGGGNWWSALLRPHDEHHILGTRLLTVGLLAVNGQWDPLLEMVAGALISACGLATLLYLGRELQPIRRWVWAGVLILAGVLPYGWEDTLWGFQSQVYLVVSGGILVLTMASEAKGAWIWGVATLGALAVGFSMAGGFLLAAPFAIMAVLCWITQSCGREQALCWAASASLLAAVAWWTRNPVPGNEILKAPDYPTFASVATTYLAWPLSPGWLWFIPMMGPIFALAVRRWRSRSGPPLETFAIVLGTWGAAFALVLAWGRGGQFPIGTDPPSRYLDMLILIPVANVLALLLLWRNAEEGWRGRILNASGWAWMAAVIACLGMTGFGGHAKPMIDRLTDPSLSARTLTRALRAGTGASLQNVAPETRTYPNASVLWGLLQDPAIKKVLPASLQSPLASAWQDVAGDPRGVIIDGPGVPVVGPSYSSFADHRPNRVETVHTESFETSSGGVIFEVYVSPMAEGTIELRATNGSWRRSWRLEEFTPGRWVTVTQILPRCSVILQVTTESPWGGVAVTPPRWISRGSVLVRRLLEMSRGLVVAGAVVLMLGLGFSSGDGPANSLSTPDDGIPLGRDDVLQ